MSVLFGNAVVGQSGGPTAAINATLAGVIKGAQGAISDGTIGKIYGMRNGIEGFLSEDLIDLSDFSEHEALKTTPAAALGSCRKRLKAHDVDAETYERILEVLKKYDIRYFFYIGGNDSMDTVLKLSNYAKDNDYELRVVGVPKTIDNDLMATDHTPGFASAAKFIATTIKEIRRDIEVYRLKAVTIVEIMGRDAGWLTSAAALPEVVSDKCADLIYLPECAFDVSRFVEDVKALLDKQDAVLVAVSEGIRDKDGEYIGANSSVVDAFGHKALSGAGKTLEGIVKAEIGCKVRSIELNLPQRCASHLASLADINESVEVGNRAVFAAVSGRSGVMMTILRRPGDYSVEYGCADISGIANGVRGVPSEYINAEGNGVTEACLDYLAPLIIGEVEPEYYLGMPKHIKL